MEKEKIKNKKKIEGKKNKASENKMREIRIEKIVLSIGAVGEALDKGAKLLDVISGGKSIKTKSKRRIPAFAIRPGLEIGCKVTIRGKNTEALLKRLLSAGENKLKEKQIVDNGFSFGIAEYIEIPEMEYHRDIGMMGLNVTVVFERTGKRVKIKKIKRGKVPRKQQVTREEIIKFMKEKFKTEILGKEVRE